MHDLVKIRVHYVYHRDLSEGIGHSVHQFLKVLKLIVIYVTWPSGYAVPTFVVDAPGGGGKLRFNQTI